ncbi:hypothetical protein [Methanolacinia petrolearia]|uniref:hypothetical protein n=1 Tax=Methanolacinia petrolearia TaxID=54120 RepID=UPI003BAA7D65
MSTLTENLGLVKHAFGTEGWGDDMNANLDEIDNVLADISKSNIFINPMLRFWQRGTSLTGVSGYNYLADRWEEELGSTQCIVSRQEFNPGQTDVPCEPQYYHRLFSPAGYLTQSGQRIEDVRTCAGQQTVISFYARADRPQAAGIWVAQDFGSGGSTWVLVNNTSYLLTTSWQKYVFPVNIPPINGKTIGASSNLYVGFNRVVATEDVNIDFALPQFNLGGIPLPFKPRPEALEELLCRRNYRKSYAKATNPGTVTSVGVHQLYAVATGTYMNPLVIQFDPPMRTTPTMTYYSSASGASGCVYNVTTTSDVAILGNSSSDKITIPTFPTIADNLYYVHYIADSEIY